MKAFLMSLYTVLLLATGFYARGICQTITIMQQSADVQIASTMPQGAQDAFSKLAQHLTGRK